jgi:hypothetical protein
MSLRVVLVAVFGIAVILSTPLLAGSAPRYQEPTRPCDIPRELYVERVDRAETSPEWNAYLALAMLGRAEDIRPGAGFALVSQTYEVSVHESLTLLKAVRSVQAEAVASGPKVGAICRAGISSAQDYVDWWTRFDAEMRAHRHALVDALISAVGASAWEAVMEREYGRWLASDEFGMKINRQAQVEVGDYRIWMRMCGERND